MVVKVKKEDKELALKVIQSKPLELLEEAEQFIQDLKYYRKLVKFYTTYIVGVDKAIEINQENKVYFNFNLAGTVTGRLSCTGYDLGGRSKGVSFHTLSREGKDLVNIRRMFVAPKGWAFITADESQMELRSLAHVGKVHNMVEAFKKGIDLHKYTASLGLNKEFDKITKEERQIFKSVSFLIVYGGGEYHLSEMYNISLKKAKAVIDSYKKTYPQVFAYMEYVYNFIKKNKYAYTLFGRKRHLENIETPIKSVENRVLRQGLNFTIQSTASDILTCAILGFDKDIEEKGLKAQFKASVHDSMEVVCPVEELDIVLPLLRYHMVEIPWMKERFNLNFRVPFKVDMRVGFSFGDGVDVKFEEDKVNNLEEIKRYLKGEK